MTPAPSPDQREHLARFTRQAMRERVPLDGSIELTHRCNLRCVHCYLGDQRQIRQHRHEELDTAEVKRIIDELVAAGTLNLTFTGGDPMVRRDFAELYSYAVRRGLLMTVFCDAVLVTERTAALFERYPPRKIEVSIYGATRDTYEAITQVRGSFDRCIAGIERLHACGQRLTLKTVLMQANRDELDGMRALARRFGADFYFDTAVFPCLPHADNGGGANAVAPARSVVVAPPRRQPLEQRLSPESAAEARVSDPTEAREIAAFHQRTREIPPSDRVYTCGAGLTTFHIDPYGRLEACTISTNVGYDLRRGSFDQGWNGPIAALRARKASPDNGCARCDKRAVCSGCPAMFEAETGDAERKSDYVCRSTHALFRALERTVPGFTETHS